MTAQATALFEEAFATFLASEHDNIISNVSERNLCSRLGMAMDKLLGQYGYDGYFVDAEYNRKQDGRVKTIINGNMEVVRVTCDLILHSRGQRVQDDNILAVEMKKGGRPQAEKETDRHRLMAMTKSSFDDIWSADGQVHPEHVCGYKLGVYVELDLERNTYLVEFYAKGQQTADRRGSL